MWKTFLPWCAIVLSFFITPLWVVKAGPDPLVSAATPRPPRDRALVFFYREPAFQANWFAYRITDGDQKVGSVRAGRCLAYLATPGEHTFEVRLLAGSRTTLTLKAGQVYYLRAEESYEVLYERPQLSLVPTIEGVAVVTSLDMRLGPRLVGERLPLPRPRHGLLSY